MENVLKKKERWKNFYANLYLLKQCKLKEGVRYKKWKVKNLEGFTHKQGNMVKRENGV